MLRFAAYNEFNRNFREPVQKSTANRYERTNSRFAGVRSEFCDYVPDFRASYLHANAGPDMCDFVIDWFCMMDCSSFQHKGFWMPWDAGCLAEENGYENSSRIEPKRSHQWFMNTGEPETLNNKKQAVEAASDRLVSAVSHVNVSQWDTSSGFHSVAGQFSDRLFGSDLARTANSDDKNMPSIGSENLDIGRRDFGNQYGNDPLVGLSMSYTIGGPSPSLNFGGIGKVNQVRDSDHCMSGSSIGHSYNRADNSTVSIGAGYNKNDGNLTMGPTYSNGNDTSIATRT